MYEPKIYEYTFVYLFILLLDIMTGKRIGLFLCLIASMNICITKIWLHIGYQEIDGNNEYWHNEINLKYIHNFYWKCICEYVILLWIYC